MKNILVIIPAYNEYLTIEKIVKKIGNCLPEADILIIDDGSLDATARTAANAGADVVSHPFNMGYGVALQTGYKYARLKGYDYILQIDADGQHEPEGLQDILKILKAGGADVVIGSRYLNKSEYPAPFLRLLGMKFFAFLTSLIICQKITDSTSGFQGFNKKTLGFLVSDYFPVDYPDADVIVMFHRYGFKIKEIPVVMTAAADNSKSMHSGMKPLYYVFKMTLSLFMTFLRKKENIKWI